MKKILLFILAIFILTTNCFALTGRLNDPAYLKGYWRLNGNAADYSGNGNHGTWSGTEAYGESLNGKQAGSFDGSSAINTGVNIFESGTLSFWVRVDNFGTFDVYIGAKGSGSLFLLDNNTSSTIVFRTLLNGGIQKNIQYDVGSVEKYSYISMVWISDLEALLYVNGVYVGQAYIDDIATVTENIYIGGGNESENLMDGRMYDVRYYNVALTATEIEQLYYQTYPVLTNYTEDDDSLVLHLLHGDRDLSDTGATLTNEGVVVGNGMLSKAGDYLDTSFNIQNDLNDSFTLSFWVNRDSSSSTGFVYSAEDGGGSRFYFQQSSGTSTTIGLSNWIETFPDLEIETYWSHYVISLNGNAGRIYVNGAVVKQNDSITISKINNTLRILSNKSGTDSFDGKLKDFKIYNEAKPASWVLDEYMDKRRYF